MSFAGHRPRKRFGQHWLVDPTVLDRIVAAAELRPGERVLEIGPGRGALSERLLATPLGALVAVELDRDLLTGLQQRFGTDPRFQLIEGDGLEVALEPEGQPRADAVVANIPYNITGPLLERLVGRLDRPVLPPYRRLVLLVQREVGERIRARAGESAFSALSVRLQLLARCRSVCAVPPRCFAPPPRVDSEVIVLDPLPPEQLLPLAQARTVEMLLRQAFAARRKMLRNTLAPVADPDTLLASATAAGIALAQRPQEVAPEQWVALAAALAAAGGGHSGAPVGTAACLSPPPGS